MRLMKILLRFFIVQMLLGNGAVFAAWTQIGESKDYTGYVDISSLFTLTQAKADSP